MWKPHLQRNASHIESVQKRFLERLIGMKNMSFIYRLVALEIITASEATRHQTELVTAYKIMHDLADKSPGSFGLHLWHFVR